MQNRRLGFACFIAIGCALWLAGCLAQEIAMAVRYDAKRDVFAVFTVYEHFRSSRNGTPVPKTTRPLTAADYAGGDLGRLQKLWEGRERLIPLAPLSFDGPIRMELTADRSKIKDAEMLNGDPHVSWDKVEILPGRLFEDRDGLVGYWHEVRVPGSVVDELLRLVRVRLGQDERLSALVDVEVARRKGQKKIGEWVEVSDWLKKQIELKGAGEKTSQDASDEFERRLVGCLEDRSLEVVSRAVRGGEIDLSRRGAMLRLRIAVTRRDADGLVRLLRQYNASLVRLEKEKDNPQGKPDPMSLVRAAVETAGTMRADENGCAFEVNAVALLNQLFAAAREEGAKTFAADANAKAMTKVVEEWQAESLLRGVEVEKLLAEFKSREMGK